MLGVDFAPDLLRQAADEIDRLHTALHDSPPDDSPPFSKHGWVGGFRGL